MTKKEVKDIFHRHNVQLSPGSYKMIEDDLRRYAEKKVTSMAKRCKKGNVKRLTEDLYYIAIGKLNG